MVQKGDIKIQYVSTDEKVVDVLTKPLSRVKFEYFYDKLDVVRKYFPHKEVLSTWMALIRLSADIPYAGTQKGIYGLNVA